MPDEHKTLEQRIADIELNLKKRCGPNHLVSNPERITSALLNGFEPERNGSVSRRAHTVEDGRDVVASIDARDNQEAHLIDETGLEEGPVDVAASLAVECGFRSALRAGLRR